MNLAGSRLSLGGTKHRCKGRCHLKATFRKPQRFQRNKQQTFTDTGMFFFLLSPKKCDPFLFLKLYILLYIFFSKREDWHLYSAHGDVTFQNSKSET